MFIHLTNYAINKFNEGFIQNNKKGEFSNNTTSEEDNEEECGHKRSLNAILKIIYSEGGDPDKIMDEIKDIIIKTIIAG